MIDSFLVAEIDGSHRAAKHEVFFDLFKIKTKNVTWYATDYKNLALFYGNDTSVRNEFFDELFTQSVKKPQSLTVTYFDRCDDTDLLNFAQDLANKKKHSSNIRIVNDTSSFVDRISSFMAFRENIKEMSVEAKMVEPPNKKLDIILLHLNSNDVKLLASDPSIKKSFVTLLTDSRRQRISLFVLYNDVSSFPNDVIEKMDWVVSIGVDASFVRKNIYSNLDDTTYDINQKVIGNLYQKGINELSIIHPRKYAKSDWRINEDIQIELEKETYENYLQSLDDGS